MDSGVVPIGLEVTAVNTRPGRLAITTHRSGSMMVRANGTMCAISIVENLILARRFKEDSA